MGAPAWVWEGGSGLCGHLARLPVNLRIAQARPKVNRPAEIIKAVSPITRSISSTPTAASASPGRTVRCNCYRGVSGRP